MTCAQAQRETKDTASLTFPILTKSEDFQQSSSNVVGRGSAPTLSPSIITQRTHVLALTRIRAFQQASLNISGSRECYPCSGALISHQSMMSPEIRNGRSFSFPLELEILGGGPNRGVHSCPCWLFSSLTSCIILWLLTCISWWTIDARQDLMNSYIIYH